MTVNVTDVSRTKLSDEPGFDVTYATFEVDEDFTSYEFTIDGTSQETGTDIEVQIKNVETYQSVTVADLDDITVREMRAYLANTPIVVEINDEELIREGVNPVTVYAKDLDGTWTTQ